MIVMLGCLLDGVLLGVSGTLGTARLLLVQLQQVTYPGLAKLP